MRVQHYSALETDLAIPAKAVCEGRLATRASPVDQRKCRRQDEDRDDEPALERWTPRQEKQDDRYGADAEQIGYALSNADSAELLYRTGRRESWFLHTQAPCLTNGDPPFDGRLG